MKNQEEEVGLNAGDGGMMLMLENQTNDINI